VIFVSSLSASTKGDPGGPRSPGAPSPDEIVLPIALGVKEGGEIGMIDPPSRSGGDQRLSMVGYTDTGDSQHRQIVGTVADRHRVLQRNTVFRGQSEQRLPLGLARHDRALHGPSNGACGQIELVRDHVIETERSGDPFGKDRETARNERRYGAGGAHRRDQLPRSRCEPKPLCRFFQHLLIHPLKQTHPFLESGGKIDLAVHCSTGDFRDFRPQTKEVCELVEHFILDDRRLHIGDEKSLAPICRCLNEDVDRLIANQYARRLFNRRRVERFENEIADFARREPDRLGWDSQTIGDRGSEKSKVRPVWGTGDQGKDHPHVLSFFSNNLDRLEPAGATHKPAPPVLIIAGPTASGKSVLALELAETLNGTIINADSLQSYRDLRILTARPDAAAELRLPHRLYGFLDAGERGSVARWRALALGEIAGATRAERLPILVGGTGLYIRALEKGLAPVPEIPEQIRREAIDLNRTLGGVAFRERLAQLDPAAAGRLYAGDRQRLIRAFEVVRATGVPIGDWQQQTCPHPAYRFGTILLAPARERLYAACNARFVQMIEAGALGEAEALAARGLDPDLPAMKAVGVPELLSHIRGKIPLDEAIAAAQRATRRYAKRQTTWFRHQCRPGLILDAQLSESLLRRSRHFIDAFLLTAPG
jgi:tRNA dimethylallyltransferase